MTHDDYLKRRKEVVNKFTLLFAGSIYYSALHKTVIEVLIRDDNPYKVIEHLLDIIDTQQKELFIHISANPPISETLRNAIEKQYKAL